MTPRFLVYAPAKMADFPEKIGSHWYQQDESGQWWMWDERGLYGGGCSTTPEAIAVARQKAGSDVCKS